MVWAKRFLLSFLSVVFVVTLIATAVSASANSALSKPNTIEAWLNQSDLYQNFINNATSQAIKAAGSSESSGSITLSDSAVQQAAYVAFTNKEFEEELNTFVGSNYSWLEGKSAQPNFTINLTNEKQTFAAQIGQYVQAHLNSLPVCTAAQLAELSSLSNIDPLNITCRPPTLNPSIEAGLVSQKVYDSTGFLSNPVISASDINYKGNESGGQPYYKHFSTIPKAYKAVIKLPLIYAAIAVISGLGIIYIAPRRRNGLRIICGSFFLSAVVVLAIRLVSNSLYAKLEKHLFNETTKGQLQQSLTEFIGKIEARTNKIELYFIIVYAVLFVLTVVILLIVRNRKPKRSINPNHPPSAPNDRSTIASRLSNTPREAPRTAPTPLGPPPKRRVKRPPRLIQ
jgi:predicted secreted protein